MLLQFKPHYIRLRFPNMYTEFRKLNCTLTKEASTIYGYSGRLADVLGVVNSRWKLRGKVVEDLFALDFFFFFLTW